MTALTVSAQRSTDRQGAAVALLGLCMFTTGASGLVVEYVLATTATYILGNSIEQFSIIIALMMLMMGVAGFAQRFVGNSYLLEKFVAVEVAMALLGSFAPIGLYFAYGVMHDHFNLALYLWVASIGFLIGFEVPLVMRIIEQMGVTLKSNLMVLAMDYIGAFAGALLWVSFLLPNVPVTEASFIVAGCNFLVAVVAVLYFARQRIITYRITALGAIAVTACALTYGYAHNRSWNVSLEQKLYDDPIVTAKTTRYQHLVVTHNQRSRDYRLYINGNTQFSSKDEAIYHEQLVHPAMALVPDHRRVLILGGGDGMVLREVLKYPGVESVTLVDLDPDMIRLAQTDPILSTLNGDAFADARVLAKGSAAVSGEGLRVVYQETGQFDHNGRSVTEPVANVQVVHVDADRFISEVDGMYNVILIDLPDPNSIELVKLYSEEFYTKLRRRLAERGMVAIQATSPYHAKEAYLAIGRTMNASGLQTLPYHDNVPSFGDWGWYLAWRSGEPVTSIRTRITNTKNFAVATRYLTPDVFRKGLVFGKGWLASEHTDTNTLMNPVLLRYYLEEGWKIE